VEQWQDRLVTRLDLTPRQIGQLGGGRNNANGIVDVAMVQSLARRDDISDLTAGYGMVIVDECHHVPAVTFERAVREIAVRRWVGLTATPYRRDGLQALMAMHCGPVRYTMTARPGAALQALDLIGRVLRPTDTKTRVEVHDYVDTLVPVLARMHDERRTAYATLGFDLPKANRRTPRSRSIPGTTSGTSSPEEPF